MDVAVELLVLHLRHDSRHDDATRADVQTCWVVDAGKRRTAPAEGRGRRACAAAGDEHGHRQDNDEDDERELEPPHSRSVTRLRPDD